MVQIGVSSVLDDDQETAWQATTHHETTIGSRGMLESACIHRWNHVSLRVMPPIADDSVYFRYYQRPVW